jgi:hypothetical protein
MSLTLSNIIGLGAGSALSAVAALNQFNSVPTLYLGQLVTGTTTGSGGALSTIASNASIPSIRIENSAYKVSAQSAVSTQVLVSIVTDPTTNVTTSAKQYITDNVAPGPRTWTISGWISSTTLAGLLFNSPLTVGLDTSIRKQEQALWDFFYKRSVGQFRDKNGQLFPYVVIESVDFDADALTQNALPISLTLKQINILQIDSQGIQASALPSDPTNPATASSDLGQAVAALPGVSQVLQATQQFLGLA